MARHLKKSGPARLAWALVACSWLGATHCRFPQDIPLRQENYVTVRLHDSLSRYDSVDVSIVVAGDTSVLVGEVWEGALIHPAEIPSYRLPDAETRAVAIRVRGFDSTGALVMAMLITKNGGAQTVVSLAVPVPVVDPKDPVRPGLLDSVYKSWKFRGTVTIDMASLGQPRDSFVKDFPVLLRLDAGNFNFDQALAGGGDIRFTNLRGDFVSYEIARWESGEPDREPRAEIWIRSDTLRGSDAGVKLKMFWGNGAASSTGDGARIFSRTRGYVGVYHLSEQAKGAAGEFKDATGWHPGTGGSGSGKNLPRRVEGVVGYGQDFSRGAPENPTSAQGTIALPDSLDPGELTWTYNAWVRRMSNAGSQVIFEKSDFWVAGQQRFELGFRNSGELVVFRQGAENYTGVVTPDSRYFHLGLVYQGGFVQVYIDGLVRTRFAWNQGGKAACKTFLGAALLDGSSQGFLGQMDEVWFATPAQSAMWMRMLYENQKPDSRFVTFTADADRDSDEH